MWLLVVASLVVATRAFLLKIIITKYPHGNRILKAKTMDIIQLKVNNTKYTSLV